MRMALLLLAVLATAGASAQPLFKVGLVSDTHVGETVESCARVRAALEIFRREGAALVCNLGDIADHHYPQGYRSYRAVFNEVFGANRPKEAYVYAGHDATRYKGGANGVDPATRDQAFEDLRRLLEIPHGPYAAFDVHGYPFVIVPQYVDLARMEEMIVRAETDFPDKPVFVLDHVPAYATTHNTTKWGDPARRKLLDRHPRVVHLDGHTHASLRDEEQIWQGGFTTVNACTLQGWAGKLVGGNPSNKPAYGCLVMEVFADRLVFRRYDIRDGSEYRADAPWTVPWPFDPKTAPYREGARSLPPVTFAADASVTLAPPRPKAREIVFSVPAAREADNVLTYRFELLRNGRPFARRDVFGEFYLRPADRTGRISCAFETGFFEKKDEPLVVRVTPVDFFGCAGQAVESPFAAPERAGKVVFRSSDLAKDGKFLDRLDGEKPATVRDGFVTWRVGNVRLCVPDEAWAGTGCPAYQVVLDLETEQPKDGGLLLLYRERDLATGTVSRNNLRIAVPDGRTGRSRYVFTVRKKTPTSGFDIVFNGVIAPLKVKVHHMKVVRL